MSTALKTKPFKTFDSFYEWLQKNHHKSDGIWLKFYKVSSGIESIAWDEAVEVALCFGWIDSQKKSLDEKSYIQRYTPRRRRSLWSKRNTETAKRLIKKRKMHASGLKEIKLAKLEGRWFPR